MRYGYIAVAAESLEGSQFEEVFGAQAGQSGIEIVTCWFAIFESNEWPRFSHGQ